ncbi:guanylate cyclase [Methylobacterium variabile]|jgi:Adenylate and Guanylate cyclase catalytic domain|uniref:Guanylate cyclase n=1 Tax=Methylobacterium variabile TaxID=298794 RepID=A0A0J6SS78_9HYPH|nr:adenylate/guanylate cyclase domain-containing protein [Methylobacterium variabile]KMO36534.1 guanylate cyclase [Methylobacterium variabile]
MAWDLNRSRTRIARFMSTVPQSAVDVRTFDQAYLSQRTRDTQARGKRLGLDEAPIFALPRDRAIVVDGVHVYAQLLDYHDQIQEQGHETEASHKRVLQFLHLHYSATDRVVEEFEAQRVDYHGPRLHAVLVTPTGDERQRVLRAVAFAVALKETIEAAGRNFGGARLRTRVRIGIDTGRAVAVSSGRGADLEPLFLGSPANYAAKLAEGDRPGIYLSDRARTVLSEPTLGWAMERSVALAADRQYGFANAGYGQAQSGFDPAPTQARVLAAVRALQSDLDLATLTSPEATFRFHRHEPPLKTIGFGELMPSRSIRMGLASVFADLSGFTAYVDACIQGGRVAEMTANLHVIRGELAACARDDFGARKVRFIGDCLHGLVAVGTRLATESTATVDAAVMLAGGLRSSFDLCRGMLPGLGTMGIAIGSEYGETPISRIGIRGDRSVRCASSKAVSSSEAIQSDLNGRQTALGPVALANASPAVRRLFGRGPAEDLDHERAARLVWPERSAAPARVAALPASVLISQGAAAAEAVRERGSGRHA